MSRADQVALIRAAARGYEANGERAKALTQWNRARLILGLPPRRRYRLEPK